MAAAKRLVADPMIGVSDVMAAFERFLDDVDPKKMNLYTLVAPPAGVSWKSSASPTWLMAMAPLLRELLAIAKNGVLPGKRTRAALEQLDEKFDLNKMKGKSRDDWADFIDDRLRMCLAHLRGLKASELAKQRMFRKADARQQQIISELLDSLQLPLAGAVAEGEPALADEPSGALAARPRSEESLTPRRETEVLAIQDTCPSKQASGSSMVCDPAAIFDMVLNKDYDKIPEEAYPGSSSSPARTRTQSLAKSDSPPQKTFLTGLMRMNALTEEDADTMASLQQHEPSSSSKTMKPKAKAKTKGKAKLAVLVDKKKVSDKKPAACKATAKKPKLLQLWLLKTRLLLRWPGSLRKRGIRMKTWPRCPLPSGGSF